MDVAEAVTVCQVMPASTHECLWDSIVVPSSVKDRLLRSALLGLRLRSVLPFEVTALHGLILLYGPPGTGKTTLARGLAHQLTPFTTGGHARLIEVSPYGLMSAEHGQSQRKVSELLGDYIPSLADDGMPTVVLLDEVESMAVARSEASLAANPADVHRATDAVLAALDANASRLPHIIIVATSNFTKALDEALVSRADVAIEVPLPDAAAAVAIIKSVLNGMATAFPPLADLASGGELEKAADQLAGMDGRRIRKTVTEALLLRLDTVKEPGALTAADLLEASRLIAASGAILAKAHSYGT